MFWIYRLPPTVTAKMKSNEETRLVCIKHTYFVLCILIYEIWIFLSRNIATWLVVSALGGYGARKTARQSFWPLLLTEDGT